MSKEDTESLTKILGVGQSYAKDLYLRYGLSYTGLLRLSKRRSCTLPADLRERILLSSQMTPVPYANAKSVVDDLLIALRRGVGAQTRMCPAGSFRRLSHTVGDIDLLCCVSSREISSRINGIIMEHRNCVKVLCSGDKKTSILYRVSKNSLIRVDVLCTPAVSYGASLLYFTGNREHNITMRTRAESMGMLLNENGLWTKSSKLRLAGSAEAEIYDMLGFLYVRPELRSAVLPSVKDREIYQKEVYLSVAIDCGIKVLKRMLPSSYERRHSVAIKFGLQSVTHLPEQLLEIASTSFL